MAKVYVTQAGGSGGSVATGVLQLSGGAAMSSTLTAVTDQNNTASPLKLSTTAVHVNSTLQITTDSNPYIDAEDGSGNNRFQVGRDPSSQVVNIDFASNPTGGTNLVGGIRTYTDGVNLAQVMTFRKDGNIGIGTTTPGAKLDVHSASNTIVQLNRTGTGNSQIQHLMTGTARWSTGYVNTNGNYSFYDDVNSVFRANLSNTGRLTIGNGDNVGTGQLTVRGSGSTSATTSFLVQNSSGNSALTVTDDLNSNFAGNITLTPRTNSINFGGTNERITTDASANLAFFKGAVQTFTVTGSGISTTGTISANGGITFGQNNYIGASSIERIGIGTTEGHSFYLGSGANSLKVKIFYASGNVVVQNGGTFSEISSSRFTINSTTQGFLPPRMTTAEKNAIATPAAGLMVYDTTLNKLCVYTTAWETITSI